MDLDYAAHVAFYDEETEIAIETFKTTHIPRMGEIVFVSTRDHRLFTGEVVGVQYTLMAPMVNSYEYNQGGRGPHVDVFLRRCNGLFGQAALRAKQSLEMAQPEVKDPHFLEWFKNNPSTRGETIQEVVKAYNQYKEEKDGATQGREAREDRPEDGGPDPIDDGD